MSDHPNSCNRFFRVITRRGRVLELVVKLPAYAKPLYAHIELKQPPRQTDHASNSGILASYYHPDLHAWVVRQSVHNRCTVQPGADHSDEGSAAEQVYRSRDAGTSSSSSLPSSPSSSPSRDHTNRFHSLSPRQHGREQVWERHTPTARRSVLSLLVVKVVVLLDRANMYDVHVAMSSLRDAVQLEDLLQLERSSSSYKQQQHHRSRRGGLDSPSSYRHDTAACATSTQTCMNTPCRPHRMVTLACMLPATGEYILTGGGFASECEVASFGPALPGSPPPLWAAHVSQATSTDSSPDVTGSSRTTTDDPARAMGDTAAHRYGSSPSSLDVWRCKQHATHSVYRNKDHHGASVQTDINTPALYDVVYIDAPRRRRSTGHGRRPHLWSHMGASHIQATGRRAAVTTTVSSQHNLFSEREATQTGEADACTADRFQAWTVRAHAHAGLVCFALGLRRRAPQDWSALALGSRNRRSRWAHEWSQATNATVTESSPKQVGRRTRQSHAHNADALHCSSSCAHMLLAHDRHVRHRPWDRSRRRRTPHTRRTPSPMHSHAASLIHSYSTRDAQLDEMMEDGCGRTDATMSEEKDAEECRAGKAAAACPANDTRSHSYRPSRVATHMEHDHERVCPSVFLSVSPSSSFSSLAASSSSTSSSVSTARSPSRARTTLQRDGQAFLQSTEDAKPILSATTRAGGRMFAPDEEHAALRQAVEKAALQHGIAVYFGTRAMADSSLETHTYHGTGSRRGYETRHGKCEESSGPCGWTIVLPPPHNTYALVIEDDT